MVTTVTQAPLTQVDYEAILNTPYVLDLERNGYVTDVQYSYREGVDYTVIYAEYTEGGRDDPIYKIKTSVQTHKDSPYLQTVPMYDGDDAFLKEGALPKGFYDVIAHSGENLAVGDKVTVYLTNWKYWGENNIYLELEFTVTGITDYGSGLYFSDDVGRFCQQVAKAGNNYYTFIPEDITAPFVPNSFVGLENLLEGVDFTLKDNECRPSASLVAQNIDDLDDRTLTIPFLFANINLRGTDKDPLIMGNKVLLATQAPVRIEQSEDQYQLVFHRNHDHKWITKLVEVSQKTFDELTWKAASEQVSITITDYAYTDRVLESLEAKGYIALSPFRLGATQQDEEKAQQREQTLTVCLLALLAVAVLQLVLLRALFSAQTESYQLLRNIGLVSKDAKLSVLWQILIFTVLGQLIGGAGIFLCGRLGIARIADILKYLPAAYVAVLSAVHLVISMLASVWVIRVLGKQVYPLAGKYSDLSLEEDGKEAAL